jgi:hypothetical protein
MAKVIYRFEEGISINAKKFLLDDEGEIMQFADDAFAIEFLKLNRIPEEDINESIFIVDYDEEFDPILNNDEEFDPILNNDEIIAF